jgi:hypothetical protein
VSEVSIGQPEKDGQRHVGFLIVTFARITDFLSRGTALK